MQSCSFHDKCSDELYSFVPPVQNFMVRTHYASVITYVSNRRRTFHSDAIFPRTALCGTNSHEYSYLNPSTLISSSQRPIVILPHYFHNRKFLPSSLPFMSHTSFSIIILTATLCPKWLSSLMLGVF